MRGWNGSLALESGRVIVSRGLRGALVRKRRQPPLVLPVDRIERVRYAPAHWIVGYVQVVERSSGEVRSDYLATIRDPRTVTFMTRSAKWRELAEEIAAQSGAKLEMSPPQSYRRTVRRAAK
jgi:hypothetical protein